MHKYLNIYDFNNFTKINSTNNNHKIQQNFFIFNNKVNNLKLKVIFIDFGIK